MPHVTHRESLMDSIEERTLEIVYNMVAIGAVDHLRVSELYEALEQQLGSLNQKSCTRANQTLVSAIQSRTIDLAAQGHTSQSPVDL